MTEDDRKLKLYNHRQLCDLVNYYAKQLVAAQKEEKCLLKNLETIENKIRLLNKNGKTTMMEIESLEKILEL
jgi:hypothetical protein